MKMKKGLLSLLAVALTIVSCQDYDDQFAELTGLVNTLSTKVAGIETSTANLAALNATVSGLTTAIAAIPTTDSTADLTAVLAGLQAAQDDIDAIELILAAGVASAEDLAAIDVLIDTVQEGVNTLLTNNQSISVNISIVDTETLATAQGYIETGENTPAGYLLGGNLLVDHSGLTAAQITAANLMTAKLISVSGTVSVTGAVDLTGLSYIALGYTKNGIVAPLDTSITSLGSTLSVDGRIGNVSFPNLNSVLGDVTITNVASVTSLDFSTVTTIVAGKDINGGTINVASATTANFGGFLMESVTANSATSITLGQTAAAALTVNGAIATTVAINSLAAPSGILTINTPKATTIDVNALTSHVAVGPIISGANSTTVVHFDKMTVSGGLDVVVGVKEFHFPAFVTTTTDMDIRAITIAATKLKTIAAADVVKIYSANFLAPVLASVAGDLHMLAGVSGDGLANVNLPLAAFATGASLTSAATSVLVASTGDATLANVLSNDANTSLTLTAQAVVVTGVAAGRSDDHLLTLTIHGKADTAGTTFPSFTQAIAEFGVLKYLNVKDLNVVTVPTGSLVGTMTTTGKINDISIINADLMSGLTIGHGPHTYTDAPAQSVTIQNMALLKAVDLSTVTKLDTALIGVVANPLLATITAPALGDPLLANGVVSILISDNALVATATAAVPGTALAEVKSPSLTGWKAYIGQCVAAGIVSSVMAANVYTPAGGTMVIGIDYDVNGAGTSDATTNYEAFSTGDNPLLSGGLEVALIDNND